MHAKVEALPARRAAEERAKEEEARAQRAAAEVSCLCVS